MKTIAWKVKNPQSFELKIGNKGEKKMKDLTKEQQNYKAWEALKKLSTVLEKNNLIDNELRSYIWDLEDYLNDKLYYEK